MNKTSYIFVNTKVQTNPYFNNTAIQSNIVCLEMNAVVINTLKHYIHVQSVKLAQSTEACVEK